MRGLAARISSDEEIAALFTPEAEIREMLFFERELAAAQFSLGLIPAAAAEAIAQAVQTFEPDIASIGEGMIRDGVPVPALVKSLRAAVGEEHARFVHLGATSQDVVDTSLMLRLSDAIRSIADRLDLLRYEVRELQDLHGQQTLMAQTRMQAAVPFTVADKLETWARPMRTLFGRLQILWPALPVQLGGPVGDGASFGPSYRAIRADLAGRLGLRDADPWHSDRTVILDVAQGFALLTGTLGKIGQDVALMAQSEIGAVTVAGGGTSSAMAHKQNPVAAEVLVALARYNAGLVGTLHQSMVHENERSGAAWTLEWMCLPPMAETAGCALRLADSLLGGLSFRDRPSSGRRG